MNDDRISEVKNAMLEARITLGFNTSLKCFVLAHPTLGTLYVDQTKEALKFLIRYLVDNRIPGEVIGLVARKRDFGWFGFLRKNRIQWVDSSQRNPKERYIDMFEYLS